MRFLKNKKAVVIALSALMAFSLFAAGNKKNAKKSGETITDLISRNVEVVPGSYKRVVCIGAGALRMYSYVGDANLLCGVEDIDNTTLSARPKMFDSVARPYVLAYGDVFKTLPSCGVGGPNAQTAEAEKILSCNPDIVISEYEDVEKEKFVALGSDMDIIIMDAAAVKNIKPLYKEDKTLFDSCKAWNDGEVYLEMAYNAYYTNYEIALINTWFIAKTVYPDLFKDVDINAKMNEVTKVFLGKELAEEINKCPSSFGGYQKINTANFF